MQQPLVSILIPNYKTLDLTKMCLRLLRKYTDQSKIQVIVVDNDSQDESTEYLRSLTWIKLIERPKQEGDSSFISASRAYDLALEQVATPYVLIMHTDTFVKQNGWLEYLIAKIEKSPNIGGVGSWKLELKPLLSRWAKNLEYKVQSFYYDLIGKEDHALVGKGKNEYYLRSHCAMYRTDLIKKYSLKFAGGDGITGKAVHKSLVANGHKMVFLRPEEFALYVEHVNHATLILNPEMGTSKKNLTKGLRRVENKLREFNADQILQDTSLDA